MEAVDAAWGKHYLAEQSSQAEDQTVGQGKVLPVAGEL